MFNILKSIIQSRYTKVVICTLLYTMSIMLCGYKAFRLDYNKKIDAYNKRIKRQQALVDKERKRREREEELFNSMCSKQEYTCFIQDTIKCEDGIEEFEGVVPINGSVTIVGINIKGNRDFTKYYRYIELFDAKDRIIYSQFMSDHATSNSAISEQAIPPSSNTSTPTGRPHSRTGVGQEPVKDNNVKGTGTERNRINNERVYKQGFKGTGKSNITPMPSVTNIDETASGAAIHQKRVYINQISEIKAEDGSYCLIFAMSGAVDLKYTNKINIVYKYRNRLMSNVVKGIDIVDSCNSILETNGDKIVSINEYEYLTTKTLSYNKNKIPKDSNEYTIKGGKGQFIVDEIDTKQYLIGLGKIGSLSIKNDLYERRVVSALPCNGAYENIKGCSIKVVNRRTKKEIVTGLSPELEISDMSKSCRLIVSIKFNYTDLYIDTYSKLYKIAKDKVRNAIENDWIIEIDYGDGKVYIDYRV